jgi:L-aminopeptidase/D-esterase-like protein
VLAGAPLSDHPWESAGNTTLAVVLTNANLPKLALGKVAQIAFGAFHRVLSPALALYDGDLIAVLARGEVATHPHQLAVLSQHVLEAAMLRAVRGANGFGILPAVCDLTNHGR